MKYSFDKFETKIILKSFQQWIIASVAVIDAVVSVAAVYSHHNHGIHKKPQKQ